MSCPTAGYRSPGITQLKMRKRPRDDVRTYRNPRFTSPKPNISVAGTRFWRPRHATLNFRMKTASAVDNRRLGKPYDLKTAKGFSVARANAAGSGEIERCAALRSKRRATERKIRSNKLSFRHGASAHLISVRHFSCLKRHLDTRNCRCALIEGSPRTKIGQRIKRHLRKRKRAIRAINR